MDKKRRTAVQAAAALLQNANFKGFFTGKIYAGNAKKVCVPGLNCYSCPGALGSCPIGSLQSSLSGITFRLPYYIMGLLIFFGALLGRAVCAFLCPFGLVQDLIYEIPVKKKEKLPGDRWLRKLKYAVLIVMVIVLPVCVKLTPFFCKYLCPSGTLSGLLLMLSDSSLGRAAGSVWAWKVCVLAVILLSSAVLFRPFCRHLCPLGAFYGLFNRVSLLQLRVDTDRCVGCGKCAAVCRMGVSPAEDPSSPECIRCGACAEVCPVNAVTYESLIRFGNQHKA